MNCILCGEPVDAGALIDVADLEVVRQLLAAKDAEIAQLTEDVREALENLFKRQTMMAQLMDENDMLRQPAQPEERAMIKLWNEEEIVNAIAADAIPDSNVIRQHAAIEIAMRIRNEVITAKDDEIEELRAELEEQKGNYLRACQTIAAMHAAATGEPGRGPRRGVVEDIEDLRKERDALRRGD